MVLKPQAQQNDRNRGLEPKMEARTPSANRLVDQKPNVYEHLQANNNLFRVHFGNGFPNAGLNKPLIDKPNAEKEAMSNPNQREVKKERPNLFKAHGNSEENRPPIPRPNFDKFISKPTPQNQGKHFFCYNSFIIIS